MKTSQETSKTWKKWIEVIIGQWPDLQMTWPLTSCMRPASYHMFERLKTETVCKRKANASLYTLTPDSGQTWSEKQVTQVNVLLGLGHGILIFRVGVKLIDARVLNALSRSVAFYARYLIKKTRGSVRTSILPPCGRGLKVAADTYQNDALTLAWP